MRQEHRLGYLCAYSEKGSDPDAGPAYTFLITTTLIDTTEVLEALESRFVDPEIKGTDFTLRTITGIEVIANTDYDADHPSGSSLNDILQISYYNTRTSLQVAFHCKGQK